MATTDEHRNESCAMNPTQKNIANQLIDIAANGTETTNIAREAIKQWTGEDVSEFFTVALERAAKLGDVETGRANGDPAIRFDSMQYGNPKEWVKKHGAKHPALMELVVFLAQQINKRPFNAASKDVRLRSLMEIINNPDAFQNEPWPDKIEAIAFIIQASPSYVKRMIFSEIDNRPAR